MQHTTVMACTGGKAWSESYSPLRVVFSNRDQKARRGRGLHISSLTDMAIIDNAPDSVEEEISGGLVGRREADLIPTSWRDGCALVTRAMEHGISL